MVQRTVHWLCILSLSQWAISLALIVCGGFLNPWDEYISFGSSFHIGIWNREWDSRIVFFNNTEYGPYRGSLVSLEGSDEDLVRFGFGDAWGIYYRDLKWPDTRLWTLMVSLWYPVFLFGGIPLLVFARQRLKHRKSPPNAEVLNACERDAETNKSGPRCITAKDSDLPGSRNTNPH